jgi:hypothetical protein
MNLIEELKKQPGIRDEAARNIVLGKPSATGERVGGLASSEIKILGQVQEYQLNSRTKSP